MANRTDPSAALVHGQNPQNLIEKILRTKIYETNYWKEHCFGLTAAGIVEKAVELRYVGGTYGGVRKPCEFMCLVLKMLQIQPDKEIILEYIRNEDYKYVRLLGAFYLRLVARALDVYNYLEPLYNDYRRIRIRLADGSFALTHVDELVDQMLHTDYMFDIALPRISVRLALEASGALEPRVSVLDDEFDEQALEEEAARAAQAAHEAEQHAARERQAMQDAADRRSRSRSPRRREKWRRRSASPRNRRGVRSRSRERRRHDDDRRRDDRRRHSRSRSPRDRRRDRDRNASPRRERRGDGRRGRDGRGDDEKGRDRRGDGDGGDGKGDAQRDKGGRKREREEAIPMEQDPEIAEANALRAKLGLKPLRG